MILEVIGWISSFCFMFSATTQAYHCYYYGNGRGLSPLFLGLWFTAEITRLTYITIAIGLVWPVLTNHIVDLGCLLVILRYKYFPREE